MTGWEMKIIVAEARRLLELAAEDADLRAELRALAQEILAATEAPPSRTEAAPGPSPEVARPQEPEPLRELTLGRRAPPPTQAPTPPGAPSPPGADEDELSRVEARCRAKAEAARRAAERQRRLREGADAPTEDAPSDPEIAGWAERLTDCFCWTEAPDSSEPADLSSLDDVAGCFEAVAEALALVQKTRGAKGLERALPLLAEAQSALRAALRRLHAPDDPDQVAVYEWLRATAARHRIYLKRSMKADDPADPSRWPDLLARIEALSAGGQPARQQRPHLDRLRSLLNRIREGQDAGQGWREVVAIVDEMVGEGVPPSSREVRDLLLPVIDGLPDRDDWPRGFRLVLREIDRFLAKRPPPSTVGAQEPGAEVKEARRLLGGRSAVLIGGLCRRDARKALATALGLRELVWVETREHESIDRFEPAIARPDVALVLLAIRWSSHAFGEVKRFCDRHGKPLVRLPGGYGPNQVAAQILAQCSGQLGDS